MEIVIALIAVGVLGLAALVAVGKFGSMQAEPVRDVYQPPVDQLDISSADLAGIRFGVAPLGYDQGQVDQVMARVARQLDLLERGQLDLLEQRERGSAPTVGPDAE